MRIVDEKLHQDAYEKMTPFIKKSDKSLFYAIATNKTSYKIIFINVSNIFDSSMYTNFHHFNKILDQIHKKDIVKELQKQGYKLMVLNPAEDPFVIPTLQGDDSFLILEDELKLLRQKAEFIQLDLPDDV